MKRPVFLGLAALAAALSPLHAETVYVPLALHQQSGETLYRTEVTLTNPSDSPLRFTTLFIPSQADGTRQAGASFPATVPARGTFVLSPVAPAGRQGVLEISGATDLVATARIKALGRDGRVLSETPLPVVSTENLFPAGETVHLQGIGRAAGGAVRLGLVNLAGGAAGCSAVAFRPDGSRLGETPRVEVAPLSHLSYEGLLTSLRNAPVANARLEVTCDAPFYAYAFVTGPAGATFVAPSASLRSGLEAADPAPQAEAEKSQVPNLPSVPAGDDETALAPAEATPSEPVSTGPGSFELNGVFLDVRRDGPYRAFDLPLQAGKRYKQVTVDFDLYLHRWQSTWFHGITSLRRTDKTLYFGVLVKGDPEKTILDLGRHQQVKQTWRWQERGNYHVQMVYDVPAKRVTMRVSQDGKVVHTISGRATSNDLRAFAGHKVKVDFSLPRAAHDAYFPPIGSKFSNLKVKSVAF